MREKKEITNRWIKFSHGITGVINLILFFPAVSYAAAQTGDQPPPYLYPSLGKNIKPSMTVVLVALIAAFFFLGFFSVYIRQCAERRINRNATQTSVVGNGRRSRRAARGLDSSVIESFPTFLYSAVKGLKIGKGALECAVCLNEFEENETLRLLPKCNHVFHADCIDVWLSSHTTCPVCRANLIPKSGENAFVTIQVFDPAADASLQDPIRDLDDSNTDLEFQGPPIQNQDRPSRSRSIKDRIIGIFPRSHSTGHSLVQENCDRFTLRLPEDVRSQLMNSNLNRTKSCVAFPRVSSSRRGFRSCSGRMNFPYYERFDRVTKVDRWAFSLTPPFFSRTGSTRPANDGENVEGIAGSSGVLKFGKSTGRTVYRPGQCEGERSTDRLQAEDGPV